MFVWFTKSTLKELYDRGYEDGVNQILYHDI